MKEDVPRCAKMFWVVENRTTEQKCVRKLFRKIDTAKMPYYNSKWRKPRYFNGFRVLLSWLPEGIKVVKPPVPLIEASYGPEGQGFESLTACQEPDFRKEAGFCVLNSQRDSNHSRNCRWQFHAPVQKPVLYFWVISFQNREQSPRRLPSRYLRR